MWNKIKALFQKKPKQEAVEPVPLRVEGVASAPLTPVADDAELAAQALLESLAEKSNKKARGKKSKKSDERKKKEDGKHQTSDLSHQPSKEYYEQLAERVREGREMEARMTMRLLAYCEQELKNPLLPAGRIEGLEHSLLERQAIVEREGGELKTRWQHCLAETTIRNLAEIGELSIE